jgi:hypothetical protein
MRALIIKRIEELLLASPWYGDYMRRSHEVESSRASHDLRIGLLTAMNDIMLLSTYEKLVSGRRLVVQWAELRDDENPFAWVWVDGYSGCMLADGSIHT